MAEAKSVVLSDSRYLDGTDRQRYRTALDAVGANLRSGQTYSFDNDEIKRLLAERDLLGKGLSFSEIMKILLVVISFLAIPLIAAVTYFVRH